MYGRQCDGKTLRFKPSGGLLHGAMVMRDKETDSYWSIIEGGAIAGELKGTPLEEWPLGRKIQWKDWTALHPDTLVLSVDGKEHVEEDPNPGYHESAAGYRGILAMDRRLRTKASIYAFRLGEEEYAVAHEETEGGATFRVGGREIFLHRPRGAAVFRSTLAFEGSEGDFTRRAGDWFHEPSGARFDPEKGRFTAGSGDPVKRGKGFDTYWYMWSLTHPDTHLLGAGPR